ncbi:MAG TPA: protoporphyrinogen oxidase [Acidobacteriaceae bacterium]
MRRVAIVGGGIAGLTAAYELARLASEGAEIEAVLFEASHRLGGLIETVREGGFTIECGPDGWVSAKPWARELAVELGLADELIGSNDATRKTHIFLTTTGHPSGRLAPMPDGLNMMAPASLAALDSLATSPLFSEAAIAAYRAEPARAEELRAAAPAQDESVADFTLRHFGPEVLDRVAAPLLSGVFGGDVRRLSVRAVMPAFVDLERKYGSVIAGLHAQNAKVRAQLPIFTALRSGLGTLVDRLAGAIPAEWIRRGTRVTAVQANARGSNTRPWTVNAATADKRHASEDFDAVLLATPLNATRELLTQLDQHAAGLLPAESSSAVLVAFAYADAAQFPLPAGFGFLVPPSQTHADGMADSRGSVLLACTFTDQKFAHRVPSGGRLVRAFFGGAAATRVTNCINDEIAAIARMEMARILHSTAPLAAHMPAPPPVLTIVRRWPNSLPQYEVGHPDRVAELEGRLRALPGLAGLTILGNALHGVGIPDLIRDARTAARMTAKKS